MSEIAGDSIDAVSGGTKPGSSLNQLSVASLAEWDIDISEGVPKPVTPADLEAADIVVTLGREATVHAPDGTEVENWDTDEPSERGIEGMERMRLVRDDIRERVTDLLSRLRPEVRQHPEVRLRPEEGEEVSSARPSVHR